MARRNIVEACQKTNKKIVYISTDFVFDGTKKFYTEEDKPNPINWYAKTKYEGEKLIQNSGLDYINCQNWPIHTGHFLKEMILSEY